MDEVQVQIIGKAGEGPDNRDSDDSGDHNTPVSKLEQLVLAWTGVALMSYSMKSTWYTLKSLCVLQV